MGPSREADPRLAGILKGGKWRTVIQNRGILGRPGAGPALGPP